MRKLETTSTPTSTASRDSFLTRDYALLWIGSAAFYGSFQMLLTTLPVYALRLGARESDIGLLIGFFSISALLVRLPTGWLLDRGGRVPILLAGCAVFALSAAGYVLAGTVAALLAVRLFHGTGMSLFTTAAQTLVVDIAPKMRRGEAMGVYNIATTVAAGFGPAIGVALLGAVGFGYLFGVTGALAAAALVLCWLIVEPRRGSMPTARPAPGRPTKIFSRAVIGPGLLLAAQMGTYGAVISFVPLLAARRGLDNPGLFFLAYAAAILVAQALAGRASDRLGRLAVVIPGLVVSAAGLIAISALAGPWLLGAGVIYGVGAGMVQPALFAAGGERVPAAERGAAMATMGLFLELGIGGGSIVAGLVAGAVGLQTTFALAAALPAIAAVSAAVGIRAGARAGAASLR